MRGFTRPSPSPDPEPESEPRIGPAWAAGANSHPVAADVVNGPRSVTGCGHPSPWVAPVQQGHSSELAAYRAVLIAKFVPRLWQRRRLF
jgi:hypothetical protein